MIKSLKSRKGQGHIEMIMSFGLFIGFVITMLFFFRPSVKSREVSVSAVQTAILANISTDIYFFSVNVPADDCVCFDDPYSEAIGNIIIKDSLRRNVTGWISGDNICIGSNDNDFFYIFISDAYEDPIAGTCNNVEEIDRDDLGSLRKTEGISMMALENLKTRYEEDYYTLMQELGTIHNFRFALFDNLGNNILDVKRDAQLGLPVFSKDLPVEVVFKDGAIGRYLLRLYAW